MSTASPVAYPHLRERPTQTIADLSNSFDANVESLRVDSGESITISPDRSTIQINSIETPFNDDAMVTLANWVDFPKGFLGRLDADLQATWMNELLHRQRSSAIVRVGQNSGVLSVLAPNQVPFDSAMVVDVAGRVLGTDASVIDVDHTPGAFALDVVMPIDGRENLGDPKVGDIVKAGLRFDLNIAQNLAPKVNSYCYRLWCTNGCSSPHEGTKVDARGQDIETVMADLEVKARIAFAAVEADVAAMFDLRNEAVPNPERTINRIARERNLSDRMRLRLIDSIPSMVEDPNHVTMFDVIQAATHLANAPEIRTRGARQALEGFGGSIVSSHVERCVTCSSRLN